MARIGSIEDSIQSGRNSYRKVSWIKFPISFGILPVKLHPCKLILIKEVVACLHRSVGSKTRKYQDDEHPLSAFLNKQ
jgi:hypothetical protein